LTKLSDQRLSYTDAVSFAVMEERGCAAAMSFDADFAVAGFALWQAAR
jgi:predicted nucleic acid-binding protein